MDELTFILILAGIGVVLLVAMFTYYKHHKKINDEIENFNHHADTIDDVLLNGDKLTDSELPGTFTASRQDNFDIDQVNLSHNDSSDIKQDSHTETSHAKTGNRELIDGVYINSKRIISSTANAGSEKKQQKTYKKTTETFASYAKENSELPTDAANNSPNTEHDYSANNQSQKIKVVYDPIPDGVDELIISHTVLTKGEFFSGAQLYHALEHAGLSYGEMNIFHYPGDDKAETFALFSIANVIEPGTFDLHDTEMKTPGISMFMRLPTRVACSEAYEKFIHIAQIIATELGGELCDETRSQLTQQAIAYKKEQINKLKFEMEKAKKMANMRH